MFCLELVVALLGVVNYLEGASCVFRCLSLYWYFITDIPGPRGPASECASTSQVSKLASSPGSPKRAWGRGYVANFHKTQLTLSSSELT